MSNLTHRTLRQLGLDHNPLLLVSQNLTRAGMTAFLRGWCGMQIEGTEVFHQVPQFILAPTHASHLDFWAVLEGLPAPLRRRTYIAAAQDYFYANPWRRWATHLFSYHNFAFNRRTRSPQEYRHLGAMLAQGLSLLIFPEGSRTSDGRLQAIKPMVSMLAVDRSVPLIPVVVRGTHAVLPRGRFFPLPHPIRVTFGRPIQNVFIRPGESFHQSLHRVHAELVSRINEMWNSPA